jgi:hypothetical protein
MDTRKLYVAVVGALALLVAESASAAPPVQPVPAWVNISPTTSPITIDWINGNNTGITVVTYSPVAAGIWSYDGNIANQSAANIRGVVETQFGLAPSTLTNVFICDTYTSCTTGGDGTGSNTNTFTSQSSFDYLAIHFGNGELLFNFTAPQTTFTIAGLHNGLSNFRAYTDGTPVSVVPEPSTYAMLLAGLGLIGFSARRKI